MRKNKRKVLASFILLSALVATGCTAPSGSGSQGGGEQETVRVSGVSLSQDTLALEVGDSFGLVATLTPNNAANKKVTWSSSNAAVASVDANGIVTAVAAGKTVILVKSEDGEFTALCNVTVTAKGGDTPGGDTPGGDTPGGDTPGGGGEQEEDEEYVIKIVAQSGVNATADKAKAKKGETVTVNVSTDSGYTINQVLVNGTAITGLNGVYTFQMPNESAIITFTTTVTGDVLIEGEISAVLNNEGNGLYVARNVKVPLGSAKMARFSYQVKGSDNKLTALSSQALDENKCYADVTFCTTPDYALEVATGFTYDFYYDSNASIPCYIIRKTVDYLPQTEEGLYKLFEGSYHSESTVNYLNLKGYTYSVNDKSDSTNQYRVNETYKLYKDNIAYTVVEDVIDEKTYNVYKEYDKDAGVYRVVDTFPRNRGNNEYNRISYDSRFSAQFDVDPSGATSVDKRTSKLTEAAVMKSLTHGAHYGYYFEREFMYAYRVGYNSFNDEASKYSCNISSTKDDATGNITTVVDSFIYYDSSKTASTIEIHEVDKYDLTIVFDASGAPLSINYLESRYALGDWNSTTDKPNPGATATDIKKIQGAFEYGEAYEGKPTFDKTPYFISSIDKIQMYNPKTNKPTDDGNSYLHFGDKVKLNKENDNDSLPYLKEFTFTPSTALDSWQYGPIASSNSNVITRTASDFSYIMSCVNTGTSTVTFGNYTTKTGATYDLEIDVSATQKFHSIYLYSKYGEYAGVGVETAQSARVMAGTVTYFKVGVTPDSAPVIYNAESSRPDLLQITSTGEKMAVDTTGAASITSAIDVTVTLTSDWYQDNVVNKYTIFTFTILPASANPTGTNWAMRGFESHVSLAFTNNPYTGTTRSGFTNPLQGAIVDDGYGLDGAGGLQAYFYYEFKEGVVNAYVYSIRFNGNTGGWSTDPRDYNLEFYYDAANNQMGVFLAEGAYDSSYEGVIYYPIYGSCDDNGIVLSYTAFVKAAQ